MEKYSLVGIDGNAFYIMGYVVKAMRECGKSKDEIDEYLADAKSSNYDHLVCTSQDMVMKLNDECDNYCPMDESRHMSKQNRKLYESIMKGINKSMNEGLFDKILNKGNNQQPNNDVEKAQPKDKDELKKVIKKFWDEKNYDAIANIDTSLITDMSFLFEETLGKEDATKFNVDISKWDVAKVTDMHGMFRSCETFNQPIGNWDISNVKNVYWMFTESCKALCQPLNKWNKFNNFDLSKMYSDTDDAADYRHKYFNFGASPDIFGMLTCPAMKLKYFPESVQKWICEHIKNIITDDLKITDADKAKKLYKQFMNCVTVSDVETLYKQVEETLNKNANESLFAYNGNKLNERKLSASNRKLYESIMKGINKNLKF